MVTVALGFALGFGTAWLVRDGSTDPVLPPAGARVADAGPVVSSPFPDIVSSAGRSAPAPASASLDTASVEALWAQALLPPERQQAGFDAEDRLRRMAQSNPVALRTLLQRFDSDRSPRARDLLKSILSTVQTPEVVAFAVRLARSSDAAERKYGFELVDSLAPDSAEARGLIRQALASEQSPDLLVQALQALKAGGAEPEEAEQTLAQLKVLTQHADANVRRHSIMQFAQWDKKGEGAPILTQALSDRSPEVRQAAVFAIAQSGVRSDAAKASLMALLTNAQESRDMRGSAMQALERFSLSKEEYAIVAKAKAQLQGL